MSENKIPAPKFTTGQRVHVGRKSGVIVHVSPASPFRNSLGELVIEPNYLVQSDNGRKWVASESEI